MTPIVKIPVTALTDDELERLAFILQRQQIRNAAICPDPPGSLQQVPMTSEGHVTFSSGPADEKLYEEDGTPINSTKVQINTAGGGGKALIEV